MGCIDCMLIASLHADCVPHQVAALMEDMGCIDSLIKAAAAHPNSEEVQASAAGAMRNLAVSDYSKQSIADAEGLEMLINASRVHLQSATVQTQVTARPCGICAC
jgi:predicted nucleotide-binding protein